MKMKTTLLLAVGAFLGAFGWNQASAQDIRIDSIKRSGDTASGIFRAGDQIFFDVKLVDTNTGSPYEIAANKYTPSVAGERPYLKLNIPLKGMSSKTGVGTLSEGEQNEVETSSAVAFYVGQAPSGGDTLRFVYNVRPGDMAEEITWATVSGSKAPAFSSTGLSKISLTLNQGGIYAREAGYGENSAWTWGEGADGLVTETDSNNWSVSGYKIAIGDSGTNNANKLYQGLVPVTVSATNAALEAQGVTRTEDLSNYNFWVMVEDKSTDPATWKYLSAAVTHMMTDGTVVEVGTDTATASDTFPVDPKYAAMLNIPSTATSAFPEQKFFVNIPSSVAAGTKVRLCFGLNPTTTGTTANYAFVETTVVATPFATYPIATDVQSGTMTRDEKHDGTTEEKAYPMTLAAGESSLIAIIKPGLRQAYGPLYGVVERLATPAPTNGAASAVLDRSYVKFDPGAAVGEVPTVTMTLPVYATIPGTANYRVWVPNVGTADKPVYFTLTTTPPSETITLTAKETTGSTGVEFMQGGDSPTTPGTFSALTYTLSVNKTSTDTRRFKIFPVDDSYENEIPETAIVNDTTEVTTDNVKMHDLLVQYVSLQTSNQAQTLAVDKRKATLIVAIPAGKTSAEFSIVCRNDFPADLLMADGKTDGTATAKNITMAGAVFSAATCDGEGKVTGLNDVCTSYIVPIVNNVAPVISNSGANTVGEQISFNFTVRDASTDYLIAQLSDGSGNVETHLYVDQDAMKKLYGEEGWKAQLATLKTDYGITDANVKKRTTIGTGQEKMNFKWAKSGETVQWTFVVVDSSGADATVSGEISFPKAQTFTFFTAGYPTNNPATGFVRWDSQDAVKDTPPPGWTFGSNSTSNSLSLDSGDSVVAVAEPFSAGATSPNTKFTIDPELDSFFYKWATRSEDYASLLPSAEYLYTRDLLINRAFVLGGGEASDSSKWAGISLAAIFAAEWLPSDAKEAFGTEHLTARDNPNLYNFGDYNQDGVPDGWILNATSDAELLTSLLEGTSLATLQAEGDGLPNAGWGSGDTAYSIEYNVRNNGILGGTTLPDAPFTYKMRVRGRDDHLNAAGGVKDDSLVGWLSNPQWVVLVRPEIRNCGDDHYVNEETQALLMAADNTIDEDYAKGDAIFPAVCVNRPMEKIYLATTNVFNGKVYANVSFTGTHRIPYDNTKVDANNWAPVIDHEGRTVLAVDRTTLTEEKKKDPTYAEIPYVVNNVYVNTATEEIKTVYDRWIVEVPADANYKDVDKAKASWKLPSVAASKLDGMPRSVELTALQAGGRMGMFPFIVKADEIYATQKEFSDPTEALLPRGENDKPTADQLRPQPFTYTDRNNDGKIDYQDDARILTTAYTDTGVLGADGVNNILAATIADVENDFDEETGALLNTIDWKDVVLMDVTLPWPDRNNDGEVNAKDQTIADPQDDRNEDGVINEEDVPYILVFHLLPLDQNGDKVIDDKDLVYDSDTDGENDDYDYAADRNGDGLLDEKDLVDTDADGVKDGYDVIPHNTIVIRNNEERVVLDPEGEPWDLNGDGVINFLDADPAYLAAIGITVSNTTTNIVTLDDMKDRNGDKVIDWKDVVDFSLDGFINPAYDTDADGKIDPNFDTNSDGLLNEKDLTFNTASVGTASVGTIIEYTGAIAEGTGDSGVDGTFFFIDTRTPNGVVLDEPFEVWTDKITGRMDLRGGNWLDRFPYAKGADTDADGIRNGAEYFFWYYASRKAYASVFTTEMPSYMAVSESVYDPLYVYVNEAGQLVDADGKATQTVIDPDTGNPVLDPETGEELQEPIKDYHYATDINGNTISFLDICVWNGTGLKVTIAGGNDDDPNPDKAGDGKPDDVRRVKIEKQVPVLDDNGRPVLNDDGTQKTEPLVYYAAILPLIGEGKNYVYEYTIEEGSKGRYTQVNNALWPAIDVRYLKGRNSDGALGLSETFVMGRRYRNAYSPDAGDGKGNLWEPIPVEDVLAAFDLNVSSNNDPDNDGINSSEEVLMGSNPIDFDSDGDGVPDGWVVHFGLSPTASVGGGNPDCDYFATATVKLYSDYHHLYRVMPMHYDANGNEVADYAEEIGPNSEKWPTENVRYTGGEAGRQTIDQPVPGELYYDYEGDCFWVLHNDLLTGAYKDFLPYLDETFQGARTYDRTVRYPLVVRAYHTRADFEYIVKWDEALPLVMKMAPQERVLRDEEVYQTFGFNPKTGWGASVQNMSETFSPVHTAAFTTAEEFKSSVRRCRKYMTPDVTANIDTIAARYSTNPLNNDSNGDGVPDGWASYIGCNPLSTDPIIGSQDLDADGLTMREEFECVSVNEIATYYGELEDVPQGWAHLINERYTNKWTNKLYPTDPRNPDTDFDGLWDATEGDASYCYGPKVVTHFGNTVTDARLTNGGGGNPNSMDTDGDGMPDGWEYRYGSPAVKTAAAESGSTEEGTEGETEGETEDVGGEIDPNETLEETDSMVDSSINQLGVLDFTSPYDGGFDPDHDGLPNYQEYLTGLLRHLRYDLLPEAARLYADTPGQVKSTDDPRWTIFPDIYTATVDLLNPTETFSVDFETQVVSRSTEAVRVDPLRRAMGALLNGFEVAPDADLVNDQIAAPAITQAFNHKWATSMVFPTEEQLQTYSMKDSIISKQTWPAVGRQIPENGTLVKERLVQLLLNDLQALDAAYLRRQGSNLTMGSTTFYPMITLTKNTDRDNRQTLALVQRINALYEELAALDSTILPPALKTSMEPDVGDAALAWKARKGQLLSGVPEDGAYKGMADRVRAYLGLADTDANPYDTCWTNQNPTTMEALVGATNAGDYEAMLRRAKDPLLREQYRAAVRGYSGGVWREKDTTALDSEHPWKYTLGQLTLHAPLAPYADRTLSVGVPLGTSTVLAGAFSPVINDGRLIQSAFFTTSPLAADTDMDGMDDYWEIFHGLNPLLGDYKNPEYSSTNNSPKADYSVDALAAAYSVGNISTSSFITAVPTASSNGYTFLMKDADGSKIFDAATGFDYYTYPWLAGTPFADPDGDGLTNEEEATNPSGSDPAHYGTDPSPLWMTDPHNPYAFVTRFYAPLNGNTALPVEDEEQKRQVTPLFANYQPFTYNAPMRYLATSDSVLGSDTASVLPYGVNEGFDTDGDGVSDQIELTSSTSYRGDPQTLRTPDRQQAAYFGGKGALQSMTMTQFGPTSLTTFTLECWVNPDDLTKNADVPADYEMILIDRPWSVLDDAVAKGAYDQNYRAALRHNFTLGLKRVGSSANYVPFARFTGAGTTAEGINSVVPNVSPTVKGAEGQPLKAGVWAHLAVTYDGSRLVLYIDGVEVDAQNTGLIPANGVISLKNDGLDPIRRFTYRKAPILVGAGPSDGWFAEVMDKTAYSYLTTKADESPFELNPGTSATPAAFANCYFGFIDEVRIWNGARSAAQILQNRSKTFSQKELLENRLAVFNYRYSNGGFFAKNVPAELLALYSFNDLLAGSRKTDAEGNLTVEGDDNPWEKYPGEQLIGDATTPGSLLYRRTGLVETMANFAALDILTQPFFPIPPEPEKLYTSYYSRLVHPKLQSTKYYVSAPYLRDIYALVEDPAAPGTMVYDRVSMNAYATDVVPMAHNTVSHLPLMDVRFAHYTDGDLFKVQDIVSGKPTLTAPSGTPENLKVADSVYWTPHAKGNVVSTEAVYEVKTSGNPYGYFYTATPYFDALNFYPKTSYSTNMATDLFIFGDVFAKYTYESWDNAPMTDPSAGAGTGTGGGTGGAAAENTMNWFEWASGTGDSILNQQLSAGGQFFEDLFPGQTKDTDGDQMPNYWENYYGLDPEDPTGINGPHGDQDGDFLTNYAEFLARSNPGKYSTAGTGVPDYHMAIWARRGRPTFGLLYTDNDFMEDHWEAPYRAAHRELTVDQHDALADADGDGWSNWAEARTIFRGTHSTDPTTFQTQSAVAVEPAYPTPALQMEVDYFGSMGVATNEENTIVVHAYTVKNNNSAPDAVFVLPVAMGGEEESVVKTQTLGRMLLDTKVSGYLEPGNIRPGSLEALTYRYVPNSDEGSGGMTDGTDWAMRDNEEGKLVVPTETVVVDPTDPTKTTTKVDEREVGAIDYNTGAYYYYLSSEIFSGEFTDGGKAENCYLRATYASQFKPVFPTNYTFVSPMSGYLREGKNNFFVFMDLDGDGNWDEGEPAGVPDQHDVDIGFDTINTPLHVTLTLEPPPGAVRLNVKKILDQLKIDAMASDSVTATDSNGNQIEVETSTPDTSTIMNPTTNEPLKPSLFALQVPYDLILTEYQSIGPNGYVENPTELVFSKEYNPKKPYLTEDEIFAEKPKGLGGSNSPELVADAYKVYLVPRSASDSDISMYNIAVVTNNIGTLDLASTSLVAPKGKLYRNNAIDFEWLSTVQMVQLKLTIQKTHDAHFKPITPVTVYEITTRGVGPCNQERGAEDSEVAVEQYRYRYSLPRGVGELSRKGVPTLFGDGQYSYTLELDPYAGNPITFTNTFSIQMNASGDKTLAEVDADKNTSFNSQDSYYVRSTIRYTGVLAKAEDFNNRRIVIEAHRSAAFNGAPLASTTDLIAYDEDNATFAAYNPTVKVSRDHVYTQKNGAGEDVDCFWSTRFDAEVRGLVTDDPVYLMAYFDLDGDGERDAWEPWGYATMGLDDPEGFYFDAREITPVRTGLDVLATFYIQDVDTDNDKLSDAWEWLANNQTSDLFDNWGSTYSGSLANHQTTGAVWVKDEAGVLSLSAYGAQLYGLTPSGAPDANGAVKVEGMPEDAETAMELMDLIGQDTALELFSQNYSCYGLSVKSMINDSATGAVTLKWDVTASTGVEDGFTYDLTETFAGTKLSSANYVVYGKAAITDTAWTKIGDIPVQGALVPELTLTLADRQKTGTETPAQFFKVILSVKPAEEVATSL